MASTVSVSVFTAGSDRAEEKHWLMTEVDSAGLGCICGTKEKDRIESERTRRT